MTHVRLGASDGHREMNLSDKETELVFLLPFDGALRVILFSRSNLRVYQTLLEIVPNYLRKEIHFNGMGYILVQCCEMLCDLVEYLHFEIICLGFIIIKYFDYCPARPRNK